MNRIWNIILKIVFRKSRAYLVKTNTRTFWVSLPDREFMIMEGKMKKYVIMDGSWSLILGVDGTLKHGSGLELAGVSHCGEAPRREFMIVAKDCWLPSSDFGVENDTIVRCLESGEIVFTQSRFLKEVKERCECCGREFI